MPTTTALTPTIYANYHSAAIKLDFVDDTWEASTVAVTGRVLVGGVWHDTHDFLLDDAGADTYWGRIFGLDEGVTYKVEITLTRTASDDGEVLETVQDIETFTTRSSPESADSAFIYIAPTGNDSTGTGEYHKPYKTLKKAAQSITNTAGATIIMKNGTYDRSNYTSGSDLFGAYNDAYTNWDLAAANGTSQIVGTSGAYKTIRAETAGAVNITGKKLITIASGDWTRHAANIYRADFSSYMDTTNKTASRWLRKESDGTMLYHCAHLTTNASTGDGTWLSLANQSLECWVIDWTNNRIYVRTPTDDPPASGTYSTGYEHGKCSYIQDCQYLIIEGLTFEMFGSIAGTGTNDYSSATLTGPTARGGLVLYSGNSNVVVRNCDFNQATWTPSWAGGSNSLITFEDGSSTGHNWWDQYDVGATDLVSSSTWGSIKSTTNEDFLSGLASTVASSQIVIRRWTYIGGDDCISLNNTVGHTALDMYECSATNIFDGAFEANEANGILKNCAFWHNTFTNCLYSFRFTSLTSGPVWVIGNYGTDCGVFNTLYIGGRSAGAASDAHTLVYNNTLLTQTRNNPQSGSSLNLGFGTGRLKLINNVLSHPFYYIGDAGDESYTATNELTNNCIWSPYSAPKWMYDATEYATQAAYIAAAGADATLSGNVYINPYPDGIGSSLDADLLTYATEIKGITTIAANSLGVPYYGRVIPIGRFPKFAYPLLTREDRQAAPAVSRRRSFTQDDTS